MAKYQDARSAVHSTSRTFKWVLILLILLGKRDHGTLASSRKSLASIRIKDRVSDGKITGGREAIRLRGGASEIKPTTKKGKKHKTSRSPVRKEVKRTSARPAIFQLTPLSETSTSTSSSTPFLEVKALLADRVVNWKLLSRAILGALVYFFLLQCVQTAGIPRNQAIWSILNKAGLLAPTPSASESLPPTSFQPTKLEIFLAETLAKAARDMIPPSSMPSGPAFIGALLSCLAWILLTVLLPHWLLPVNVWYDYHQLLTPLQEQNIDVKGRKPTAVLVQVTRSTGRHSRTSGQDIVCKLHATSLLSQVENGMPPFYFEHNHRRYYYDPKSNQCWDGGPNVNALTVGELTANATKKTKSKDAEPTFRGLLHAPSQLAHAQDRWYAYNHQTSVPIPTIRQALWERLKSPLVVIQLIGKAIAVLEDGKAAFLALGQTVFQHYHNSRSMVKSSKTLQKDVAGLAEEFATQLVWIYRAGGWKKMEAASLLPGDMFLLTSQSASEDGNTDTSNVVPVDALVLDGLCVTMEAVLTGETVPQTKMPFDSTMSEWNQTLDMMGTHRSAIVFAGTSILHCMPGTGTTSYATDNKTKQGPSQNGALCLALRTGSYSSKGELINALTASGSESGAATISNARFDEDALRLISIMSFFSTLACVSLFWKSSGQHQKVSGFRRLIQCTRIATTCIPSDMPLSLSYIVQSCANALRQEADVVCSRPGALLTAAEIDTVVFDKTGTLTADTQSLSKVIAYPERPTTKMPSTIGRNESSSLAQFDNQSTAVQLVFAGCHSLVCIQNDNVQSSLQEPNNTQTATSLVGDPLELTALKWLGWSFEPEGGYFHPPIDTRNIDPCSVEKLWQLKVFPFSPRVRLSSALLLARHFNGEYKLWAVIKGAPEAVQDLVSTEEGQGSRFVKWYKRKVKNLESKGFRTLAMASREVQVAGAHSFQGLVTGKASKESDVVASARGYAAGVHRSDLEAPEGQASFCGLACFDAKIRSSSRRIIEELKAGDVQPMMLTGDSLGAAVAVAARIGILREKSEIAVLETTELSEGGPKESCLQWRLSSAAKREDRVIRFNTRTTNAIMEKVVRGELQMVASGKAIIDLTAKKNSPACEALVENLSCFSVVARASPECKEWFVALLSDRKQVLMCGDGVNDVSAMKEAEVSVALLNGFGTESEQAGGDLDTEDERRKQRLRKKQSKGQTGKGNSTSAASIRIQKRIEDAQAKIAERAAKRHGINATSSEPIPYSLKDLKDMLSSVLSAGIDERRRAKKLKEGGGEAATMLLEEDMIMREGRDNASASIVEVRPGEACMASPFSCLRSSIDGVEAVLRSGIATRACALSFQQKLTLNLLLTCFNLSALYRDGFRYGKQMAMAEYMVYMIVDQASYLESCRMRPRLPTTRRRIENSLFGPTSLVSVLSQTVVHIVMMQAGISFARVLETRYHDGAPDPKPLIRAAQSQSPKVAALLGALTQGYANASKEDKKEKKTNFLGQPKFVPNYETNVVFALSVLQGTLTTLLMHKGAPFYVSILESRLLCLWSGLSVVFVIACILETFPRLNTMLELRPWMAGKHKVFVLGLAIVDSLACSIIEWCCRWRARESNAVRRPADTLKTRRRSSRPVAADLEEQALREESEKNAKMVLLFTGVVGTMVLDTVLRALVGYLQPK